MSRIARLASRAAMGCALVVCTSCSGDERNEHLGRQVQGVANGTDYPDGPTTLGGPVGYLTVGTTSVCSSFLATRRYAVTAGHCFDTALELEGAVDLKFAYSPTAIPANDPRRVAHSRVASGPVHALRVGDPGTDDGKIARDIAVVRLDTRVPPDVADTARPAGITVDRCPDSFQRGGPIGYGFRDEDEADRNAPYVGRER